MEKWIGLLMIKLLDAWPNLVTIGTVDFFVPAIGTYSLLRG
jgi:hypothetical protein